MFIRDDDSAPIYSLLGLMVAHLQRRVIINEWGFEFIDSDPVDAALFTVELDPVQVDHCRENGQLHKALLDAKGRKLVKIDSKRFSLSGFGCVQPKMFNRQASVLASSLWSLSKSL